LASHQKTKEKTLSKKESTGLWITFFRESDRKVMSIKPEIDFMIFESLKIRVLVDKCFQSIEK
jgi:hypothetical protein